MTRYIAIKNVKRMQNNFNMQEAYVPSISTKSVWK